MKKFGISITAITILFGLTIMEAISSIPNFTIQIGSSLDENVNLIERQVDSPFNGEVKVISLNNEVAESEAGVPFIEVYILPDETNPMLVGKFQYKGYRIETQNGVKNNQPFNPLEGRTDHPDVLLDPGVVTVIRLKHIPNGKTAIEAEYYDIVLKFDQSRWALLAKITKR
ncbi:MAG: hypothetical protein LBJ92_04040 [Holosporales bacterium]|jgi:hypothetical protein|nr:hypothetical protein [Holosporales bacterium]